MLTQLKLNIRKMKKLMFILLFFTSCNIPIYNLENKPFLIIKKIRLEESYLANTNTITNTAYAYTGTISTEDVTYVLSEKLNIGDTIWIGSRHVLQKDTL